MRILIVTQYFWPEYFRINDLVEEFKKKDLEVDILTSYPNYPEGKIFKEFQKNPDKYSYFKNCKIFRVPQIPRGSGNLLNLVLNYISFVISSLFYSFFFLRKKKIRLYSYFCLFSYHSCNC